MSTSPEATGGLTLSYTADRPGYPRHVEHHNTFDALRTRLLEIQASRQSELFIGVNLEATSGDGMAVGLAESEWAVVANDRQHTELFYSLGEPSAKGDVELRFEQWDVLPRKYFLPAEDAMNVLRHWFTTGELSSAIPWEHLSLLPRES